MSTGPIYNVELVPFGLDEETTATRRRLRKVEAATAMKAVEATIAADRSRLVAATVLGNDRASGVVEAADDHTMYRIFAFRL